ncbi:MAG: phosphatase PAP2 family protein [Vicinamibacterales bacterium]
MPPPSPLLVRAWAVFRRARPEEALFVAAFVPSTVVTLYANWTLQQAGGFSGRIASGILRLVIATIVALFIPLAEYTRAQWQTRPTLARWIESARTVIPFLLCIAVYTNLHDTVRFVNPHDIHQYLAAADRWLFGVQPVVWAEQFITPGRTEIFSAFYGSFFLIAPSLVLLLLLTGRRAEARVALVGFIVCFYTGYVLYVVFPAAPPRLYLASLGEFSRDLKGGAMGITAFQNALISMVPNEASRAAFPSLHAAVSLLTLLYAWRYVRWYVLPLGVVVTGLLVSTVYLRHHFVVDLVAGAALVPWVLWAAPRFERWWMAGQPAGGGVS